MAAQRLIIALAALLCCTSAQAVEKGFFSEGATPAGPATPADLSAAEKAVDDVWARLPYGTRNVMFVTKPAPLFGAYTKRPNSVFAPGEKLLTYIEPVGFKYTMLDDGQFRIGVASDLELRTASGKVIVHKDKFQNTDLTSHVHVREFFVGLTLSLDGVDPGDYVLVYILHDTAGDQTTVVTQPFSIKAAS